MIFFLLFHHGIGAPTNHSGFGHLNRGKSGRFMLGDFFHQLHHKFFDSTHGNCDPPWDEWFNTFHDGSEDGNQMVKERRHKIWAAEWSDFKGARPRARAGLSASGAGLDICNQKEAARLP